VRALIHRLRYPAIAVVVGLLLSSCNKVTQPQNYLDPKAPISRQLNNLIQPVFLIAAIVFVLVEGLIIYISVRYRRRSDDDAPEQIHGNTKMEITWTAIPALVLAVIGVFTVINVGKLDQIPHRGRASSPPTRCTSRPVSASTCG
jgi:cytochrome c oxidase subunit 2